MSVPDPGGSCQSEAGSGGADADSMLILMTGRQVFGIGRARGGASAPVASIDLVAVKVTGWDGQAEEAGLGRGLSPDPRDGVRWRSLPGPLMFGVLLRDLTGMILSLCDSPRRGSGRRRWPWASRVARSRPRPVWPGCCCYRLSLAAAVDRTPCGECPRPLRCCVRGSSRLSPPSVRTFAWSTSGTRRQECSPPGVNYAPDGAAVLVHPAPTEQGYAIRSSYGVFGATYIDPMSPARPSASLKKRLMTNAA